MLVVRVLGPIEVELDGCVVDLGGPAPRRFLSALSMAVGAPVSDAVLSEWVWGADQPRHAVGTLRVMASRLRSALGAREYLQRGNSGYLLAVPPEWVDHHRFAELITDGVRLLASGDAERAARLLAQALGLWRGEPWPELDQAPASAAERIRLVELREIAIEELQAARLACGDTATAVADLSEAVTAAPFRERRWELLALGLYRSGRQAHALAELRRVRELLIEELGVEPGPALRGVEQRMLDHDPDLLLMESPRPQPVSQSAMMRPVGRPLSAFIGRRRELGLLAELLADRRMVSLVGPGGVGKTRLAVEYCAAEANTTDRWLVRLGDVHDGDAVVTAIASALGLIHLTGDPLTLVRRALTMQPGLLVLDNCEHLIEPIAELAVTLLAGCPELRILATSRQPLGIDGEHVLTIEPLRTVDSDGADGAAVDLLIDRVRAARPGWQPTGDDLGAAREICVTVDGLPLAIELAAARERAFGLAGVAAHIRDRLDVLGPTPRGSLSRHASLQAAIGWSIDHLGAADRAMLLRLWPFEGGFGWEAAESVQSGATDASVLATLASLLDRSVITTDRTASGVLRYRLLETIRRYCRDIDPDPQATRAAHAEWVRAFAGEQAALLTGHRAGAAYRALAVELPNIRAGITYDLACHPVHALRTTASLQFAWGTLGVLVDGRNLIRTALDLATDATPAERAHGLLALSIVSFHAGDPGAALARAESAMGLLDSAVERELWLHALMYRALAITALGDPIPTRAAVDDVIAEVERGPAPDWIRGCTQFGQGLALLLEGQPAQAISWLRAARELSADCGHLWCEGMADVVLALSILSDPDDIAGADEALAAIDRALTVFAQQSNTSDALGAAYAAAYALMVRGLPEQAIALRAAAVHHSERVGADPRRYAQFAHPAVIERMDRLLSAAPAAAEPELSWTAMVGLIADAAGR
ncbi:BTAD domain-containing putative transcriptional regulator [Nocardia sp. NPDC006630]|uniref:ATP-binding protein n=1 Tax=Nocardia sp. NPDC006630 TaxID=3157181 RepID=UPI0033BE4EBF